MKKVLFIEHRNILGHLNFNQIYIDNLIEQGVDLKLVFPKLTALELKYPKSMYEKFIPNCLCFHSKYSLITRIMYVLQLLYIKYNTKYNRYDIVIMSSYDELSFSLISFKKPFYLVNHDNVRGFDNLIKKKCLKNISKKNFQIVFNQYIKEKFIINGIKNVFTVSHGCLPPFNINSCEKHKKNDVIYNEKKYRFIIFSPSSYSDLNFYKDLIKDRNFIDFLNENNILLILKGIKQNFSKNIQFLEGYIPKEQYQYIVLKSDIILISYPENFKYRASGVFFEACANSKKMIIKKNESFYCYRNYFNYNPFFSNNIDLKIIIKALINDKNLRLIVEPEKLKPNFSEILS